MDGTGDIRQSEISQVQKPDIACSRSFVEPRPKVMMVRTISGHECIWGFSEGRNSGRGRDQGKEGKDTVGRRGWKYTTYTHMKTAQ
jgi:hypothetical protein